MEVKVVIAFYKGQKNGGLKLIEVEGEGEKGKEVIVSREIVSSKWKTWNRDNFSRDWNKNDSV
jgi:hypothetical protein